MINYELEETVIGGLLSRPDEYDSFFEQLTPDDFFGIGAKDIYSKCLEYRRKNGRVIPIDLDLDEGTKKYAQYCKTLFITPSGFPDYVKILKEKAKENRIEQELTKILTSGTDDGLIPALEKIIESEKKDVESRDYESMAANQLIQLSNELFSETERDSRIYTGFQKLDECLSGLRIKTVSYIGARPSVGKTAFALNVLKQQIRDGKKTVFFSLEMSVTQICERFLSDIMRINYGRINKGKLTEKEKTDMIQKAGQIFSSKKLFIIDDCYTIEAIGQTISELKPDLVIIDFLQCVQTVAKLQTRRNEMDYISQQIKKFAKLYQCHIMGLSQMARGDKTVNKAPKMSELKESGGLEQDGDYIMILHRPYIIDRVNAKPEDAELNVEKNKYGETGRMDLVFHGEYQRFQEAEKRYG